MTQPKIKICGMTVPGDALEAVSLGVDAIGMILFADSPRVISTERAKSIRAVVPESILLVGVYVNASLDFINQQIAEIGLDLVQLHGEETEAFAQQLSCNYIKAVRARSAAQIQDDIKSYPSACAILIDPYVVGKHGGTGKQLDLQLWPTDTSQKLILAGGMAPDNVKNASQQTQAYALDLNSGVEASPGRKDAKLMRLALSNLACESGHPEE